MHKANLRKMKRNKGQEYVTKKGITVREKIFVHGDCGCRKKCTTSLPEEERRIIFSNFWEMGNFCKQNAYLCGLVKRSKVKQRRPRNQSRTPRGCSYKYFLNSNRESKPVCQSFFLSTFQISKGRLGRALKKEENKCSPGEDLRGKNEPANKTSQEKLQKIRNHISSFPSYESHYTRAHNPNKIYLNPELDIRKMYNLYKEQCESSNEAAVKENVYRHIFNNEFNLSFHVPRKDTCQKCDSFFIQSKSTDDAEKLNAAKVQHELHLRKAENARLSLKDDATQCKNNPSFIAFTFDLEKALPFPKLQVSVAYYKRNMYVYNLSCHNLDTDESHMYCWDETEGSRGSQEISACLMKHVKICNKKEITAYSDSCTGQNRNIKIALTWMKLVQDEELDVDVINHKFMISGHSYLPNDRDFGSIELAGRKKIMYTPSDWYETIKKARRNKPFIFHKMAREEFLSTKNLEKSVTKRKLNEANQAVNWLSIQWIQFRKSHPYKMFYKTSLSKEIKFSVINLLPSRGRPKSFGRIELSSLYTTTRTVSKLKKRDMLELLPFIPPIHHSFFHELKEQENIPDHGPHGIVGDFAED